MQAALEERLETDHREDFPEGFMMTFSENTLAN